MNDSRCQLDEETLLEIWTEKILPEFSLATVETSPTLFMVAAQPGAGKTRLVSSIQRANRNAKAIIGDDYRPFHPM